ncbi:amino acid permease-domain-containing protein [Aspergillus granulosus]|uniref:Amino acid permease-domain-containing protein n=1 Tax=Aspergillus granulosus TaxID=176169 RepID=A0ABR4H3P7_9EURO
MMAGLLIVSIVIFFGGSPNHDRLGFRYWSDPGAANTYILDGNTGRFLSLLSTLTLSALPFTFAPEFLILTAGEMANPRRTLPHAAKRYIYRILFFYISCILAITVICPSNDSTLTSGGIGAGASPFVVGIKNAGIPVLDSVVNAGILISAWSSGNSFLYMATRSLYSQARAGNAPRWFLACTTGGVPYQCVMVCSHIQISVTPAQSYSTGSSTSPTNPPSSPGRVAVLCIYGFAKRVGPRASSRGSCHTRRGFSHGGRILVLRFSRSSP